MKIFFLLIFILVFICFGNRVFCNVDSYFEHLDKVKKIESKINNNLPFTYNQMCLGGYFAMPSAKTNEVGTFAFCYSNSSPYQILSANFQYFDRLELSGNFWIFKNVLEPGFGKMGFGDDADRAANIKFALLKKKDGFEFLPEIAIGLNDFYGSKRFFSKYIVVTKDFFDQNFEASIGYGGGRINGFFAGLSYFPFLKKSKFFKNFSFLAELDANDYKNHAKEHFKGRDVNFPINVGINFSFLDVFQFSVNSLRGKKVATSLTAYYNIGKSNGLFPKYLDPPIFSDFRNLDFSNLTEEKDFSNNLALAFKDEGLDLMKASKFVDSTDKKCLALKIINQRYRNEKILKLRIQNVLSFFPLDDYYSVVVRVESEGINLHEYSFKKEYLNSFKEKKMGKFELDALTQINDYSLKEDENFSKILYLRKKSPYSLSVRPKINAFFGACRGKFKYDGGFLANLDGYLFDELYYNLQLSYIAKQASAQVGSKDVYNPSQIINVRSDFVKYFETNSFHIDSAFIQKNFNLKKAFFAKIALGYFELAYAGLALETLYYPINSSFAFSIEAANVYKRKYSGLNFQNKIRKFNNNKEEFEKYIGFQYFLNLYFDVKPLDLTLKTSIGQFLAKDKGIKLELLKYFKSGFEISTWITFTDKVDIVNSKRYFDKGFSIRLPLDLFMNKSSRKRFNFKMSEWLRDVGAKSQTGKELYMIIHDERNAY
ncbi:MAG TPA: hypothetical protein ENH96_05815 [Chlamydiae bacterium]|nr:hypothetical protein [Chlamydiota bacterium]